MIDDEMTPEEKAKIEAMLRPYQDVELVAFDLASDCITWKTRDVTPLYREIIGELHKRFDWIPDPRELHTDLDRQTFVEADKAIKEGIRKAIEEFEKLQEDRPTFASDEEAHFDDSNLTALGAIRAWSMENTYLPPVKALAFFSRIKASDEREFYNAIQRLREKGWTIESLGRGKGYQLIAPADVSEELQDLLAKAQLLDPERIKELKAQIEAQLAVEQTSQASD